MVGRLMLTGVLALGIASAQRGGGGGGGMGGDDSMGGIGRGQAGGMGGNSGMSMPASRDPGRADRRQAQAQQGTERRIPDDPLGGGREGGDRAGRAR